MPLSNPFRRGAVIAALLFLPNVSLVSAQPAWFVEDMQHLVGSWRADNAEWQSAAEPFDAYQIDWSWGLGQKSLHGVLVGIRDANVADTFWTMHRYWDPGKRMVRFFQIAADGTIGAGTEMLRTDGMIYVEQAFSSPGADAVWTVIHEAITLGDEHTTRSYDVDSDGNRTPRRAYTWRRLAM